MKKIFLVIMIGVMLSVIASCSGQHAPPQTDDESSGTRTKTTGTNGGA